ncbi:RES family NAD+ phosphorylase [Pigmentiphaga aceris]|uniref:RES family NAD+ phosphorylase n=1 Tax=Pigmentiphaga aceris TaxID=1940612 RepID=A0A5C0B542_9BURK|nr:RES family NAD+ phosphorylase [Pigmentiphaga aceris]QEI07717.1 RES family NAD+ phosphorylase [Pigmentiphaga aceris]
MVARRLGLPDPALQDVDLDIALIDPATLFRVSGHATGEPYFGRSGGNRFDDAEKQYGTCYVALSLVTALAESLLHDLTPRAGQYRISAEDIERRFVHSFEGPALRLANLTGASLNRLGGHGELSGTPSYEIPQAWSKAIFDHAAGVDGFIYMSRLMNTEKAMVLFQRGNSLALRAKPPSALTRHPDYQDAELTLAITLT